MLTNFTRLVPLAWIPLFASTLAAQPVTTVASINEDETIYVYAFDDASTPAEEMEITFGTTMNLDFTAFGDREIEYGPNGEESAPAKEVPLSELETYSTFAIDAAYRATFGLTLPDDVFGLRADYGEGEISEDIILIEPDLLSYYAVRYSTGELNENFESSVYEGYEPFIPLGLEYGETYRVDTTYLTSSQYEGFFDSVILNLMYTYAGYGKLKTWLGEENVGALLVRSREQYFRVDENGSYDDGDDYYDDYVYVMNGTSIIPRASLIGTYDADAEVFTVEDDEYFLFLPGSEASAVRGVGLPNARVSVAPNPTAGPFYVTLTVDRPTSLELDLFDAAGRLVLHQSGLSVSPGQNRLPVVTEAGLPAGIYLVRLTQSDGRFESRRVVVR